MIEQVYKMKSLEETLNLLKSECGAMIIAGGTDLIVHMRNGRLEKKTLIDISDIKEIKTIKEEDNIIKIGSGTTFNQIINCDKFNTNLFGLKKAASLIGSPQIRSRGTIGGNICNNSPSADLIPPLLALNAKVIIQSKGYERKVFLEDILLEKNKIDIKENEILTYIEFEKPKENEILSFSKLGFRNSLAISKISASVFLDMKNNKFNNVNIALGALSSTAIRAYEIEKYLKDKEVKDEYINQALDILEENINERLKGRSSVDFKSYAVKGVVESAISECIKVKLRG